MEGQAAPPYSHPKAAQTTLEEGQGRPGPGGIQGAMFGDSLALRDEKRMAQAVASSMVILNRHLWLTLTEMENGSC